MRYTIARSATNPILQTTIEEHFEFAEVEPLIVALFQQLSELKHPVYNLIVAPRLHFDLGTLMQSVWLVTRGNTPYLHHPNIIETVVVTRDALLIMTIKGLDVPAFGSVRIAIYPSLPQALTYIENQLAKSAALEPTD